MISSCHWCNDVVDISEVEGIINRTVNIFKNLFSIFPFYKVMVTDTVEHRAVHV